MNSESILKAQSMQEKYQDLATSPRAGSILGSKLASQGLPSIGNQLAPRKFIGDQLAQASSALSDLFESVALLEQRLACVVDAPGTAIGCGVQNPQASEPPHIEALDSIVERINVVRQLVNSLTERVRV